MVEANSARSASVSRHGGPGALRGLSPSVRLALNHCSQRLMDTRDTSSGSAIAITRSPNLAVDNTSVYWIDASLNVVMKLTPK
jgi:hypothetical protein